MKMLSSVPAFVLACGSLGALGCGGAPATAETASNQTATSIGGHGNHAAHGNDQSRCPAEGPGLEQSEYDTSGDHQPDVRRVYRRLGTPPVTRLIIACREQDLNADGTKDMVRFYNEEGQAMREEFDRNFDGTFDSISIFQNARMIRQELDDNGDGRYETRVFYDDRGQPVRAERDLAGRSQGEEWHPDRWEYYEGGRVVRMGSDFDGDGNIDRWDRDMIAAPPPGEGNAGSAGPEAGPDAPPAGSDAPAAAPASGS